MLNAAIVGPGRWGQRLVDAVFAPASASQWNRIWAKVGNPS
jgi:hypothetical protein